MKHISLGELDVSRIGLGTMAMTGYYLDPTSSDAESIRTIERAVEQGVTLIDTADWAVRHTLTAVGGLWADVGDRFALLRLDATPVSEPSTAAEVWDLFTGLPPLMQDCARLLAPLHASLVLTSYAIRASSLAFDQLCREVLSARGGRFESGELAIREQGAGARALPTSLFTRWVSDAS